MTYLKMENKRIYDFLSNFCRNHLNNYNLFFNFVFKSSLFNIYVCIKKAFFIKYSSTYNINSIDLIDNICI